MESKKKRTTGNKLKILIRVGINSIKNDGAIITAKKAVKVLGLRVKVTPAKWAKTPLYSSEELEKQRSHTFEKDITISIITPLYNMPEDRLRAMINSVLAQTYSNWELCMADGSGSGYDYIRAICSEYTQGDRRIKYKKIENNLGKFAASNICMDMSTGDYVALLDTDSILHPAALFDVMDAICDENADFIYTDEALFEGSDVKNVISVHFKPDFSIDNLRANYYIGNLVVFKRSLTEKCGRFRNEFEGAQDFDLVLRLTSAAEKIMHIPKVLYYRRTDNESEGSIKNSKPEVSKTCARAVMCNLEDAGIEAKIDSNMRTGTYRIRYKLSGVKQKVSIIIPNCDHVDDLRCCIDSIIQKTTYPDYEIMVVENNSTDPDTFEYYRTIEDGWGNKVRVIKWPGNGFNWSAINNYAVRNESNGDYILLLNNDTKVISPEWIQEMLMYAQRPDVGIVGAKLYYPDDTIQHAGVIIGMGGGTAGHAFAGCMRSETGYMGRLCYAQDVSAVTGACMLMRREVFDEVDGIDESLAVNLNDIDLCLRVREAGYLVVWTPFAELYHYESKSRGYMYDSPEKQRSTKIEQNRFRFRWSRIIEEGDPYYNPNLSLDRSYEIKKR